MEPLPELKRQPMRYVLAVVDTGSFHAAARAMSRTQPALSMAVHELEERLGQALFEKGTQAQLTPFGHYCVPRFRDFVQSHDRMAGDLLSVAKGRAGHVALATVPSVAGRLMPDLLAQFIDEHPRVTLSLRDENADSVCRMVAEGEVDLGVSSMWTQDGRLAYEHLFEDEVGVVCHRRHAFAEAGSLGWKDLLAERFIRNGTSTLLENTVAGRLLDTSELFISNMISLLAMLEAGAGVTTLPRLAFPLDSTNLRFVPLHDPLLVRRIGIITRRQRSPAPATTALQGSLRQCLQAIQDDMEDRGHDSGAGFRSC